MNRGDPNQEEPLALPVFGFLAREKEAIRRAVTLLKEHRPGLVLHGESFPFDFTSYYEEEMGAPLWRWWGRASELADPSRLREWKHTTDDLEGSLSDQNGNRTVNIDPGYLTYELLVLGSFKHEGQKIYLGDGVFADMQLRYGEGAFESFPWSFPDFQSERYYDCFHEYRLYYRTRRRRRMSS